MSSIFCSADAAEQKNGKESNSDEILKLVESSLQVPWNNSPRGTSVPALFICCAGLLLRDLRLSCCSDHFLREELTMEGWETCFGK